MPRAYPLLPLFTLKSSKCACFLVQVFGALFESRWCLELSEWCGALSKSPRAKSQSSPEAGLGSEAAWAG
eukprot:5383567-Alexandrium_andersonii.AAC.1